MIQILSLWSLVFGLWSFFGPSAMAGGPFFVNEEGVAAVWDNTSPLSLHPESGTCATFSNATMLTKIETNLANWTGITGIQFEFTIDDGEVGSVNGSNYTDFIVLSDGDAGATDDLNPVIFDDDGAIVEDLFGSINKLLVLGFAGPDAYNADLSEIIDGQSAFNCFCLAGNSNDTAGECAGLGIEFSEDDLDFTMIHEIGHMIGFDHTQVNQALAESGCDTDEEGDCGAVPTMFPVSTDAADQITPARDDEVIALTLYGVSSWDDSLCAVTGILEDASGNALRCADVQAETIDTADTIALVSGAFAPAEDLNGDGFTDDDGECLSGCGAFTLWGLDPAKDYTITVKPVDPQWVGGSGINPCGSAQLTGVVEEEIAAITDCVAGATTDLGTIETESSAESSGDSGDDGTSAATDCGEGRDFSHCDELIDCGLNRGVFFTGGLPEILFLAFVPFVAILLLEMRHRVG